jgi:hypothetical protein
MKSRNLGLAHYAEPSEAEREQPLPEDTQSAWDKHWTTYNNWFVRSFAGLIEPHINEMQNEQCRALNAVIKQQNAELARLHSRITVLARLVVKGDADQIEKRYRELSAGVEVKWTDRLFSLDGDDADDDADSIVTESVFVITDKSQDELRTEKASWLSRLLKQR